MIKISLSCAAIAFLILGCDSRTEPEKLAGRWSLNEVQNEFWLDESTVKTGLNATLTFSASEFTCEASSEKIKKKVSGTFSCDTSRKFKQIVFVSDHRRVVALYDLSGDVLRFCLCEDGTTVPTKFDGRDSAAGRPRQTVVIFIRDKKSTAKRGHA
jgi:uncharacterized protein (TIGR03067 family)